MKIEPKAEVALGVVPNDEDGTFGVQEIFKSNDKESPFLVLEGFADAFGQFLVVVAQKATEANRSRMLN